MSSLIINKSSESLGWIWVTGTSTLMLIWMLQPVRKSEIWAVQMCIHPCGRVCVRIIWFRKTPNRIRERECNTCTPAGEAAHYGSTKGRTPRMKKSIFSLTTVYCPDPASTVKYQTLLKETVTGAAFHTESSSLMARRALQAFSHWRRSHCLSTRVSTVTVTTTFLISDQTPQSRTMNVSQDTLDLLVHLDMIISLWFSHHGPLNLGHHLDRGKKNRLHIQERWSADTGCVWAYTSGGVVTVSWFCLEGGGGTE